MAKITRSRNGCFTCKNKRRKCDEMKPVCTNCKQSGRECSYGIRLSFDVDDSRHSNFMTVNNKGEARYGFRGRPRLNNSVQNNAVKPEVASSDTNQLSFVGKSTDTSSAMPQQNYHENINTKTVTMAEGRNNDTFKSVPMDSRSLDSLSGTTVHSGVLSDFAEQDTFDFINQGLDYLLGDLQSDIQKALRPVYNNNQLNVETTNETTNSELPFIPRNNFLVSELRNSPLSSSANTPQPPDLPISSHKVNEVSQTELSGSDEAAVLRHFFNRLMPLLDSHPNNPWPELALEYCDFDLARSCFLSLSCMHLYRRKGGSELYQTGMIHIQRTMDYLTRYVKDNSNLTSIQTNSKNHSSNIKKENMDFENILGDLRKETVNHKRYSFFMILILIYVHILFSVLESGKSALSRVLFKLFASIASDPVFYTAMEKMGQCQTFICILSWYDTATAIASPDCRVPYCSPIWYGSKSTETSVAKVNGCPGELFSCIHKLCHFRAGLKDKTLSPAEAEFTYKELKRELINYREYVPARLSKDSAGADENIQLKPEDAFDVRLRAATCWAISILVKLERVKSNSDASERIEMLIDEFIYTYSSLDPEAPLVVQMVWPIFNIASECYNEKQKAMLDKFLKALNKNGQTGTLRTMCEIVHQSWNSGESVDAILGSEEWLGSGFEFLSV